MLDDLIDGPEAGIASRRTIEEHGHANAQTITTFTGHAQMEGIDPLLMVVTSYVSPRLMQKLMSLERKIDIFSYEGEEDADQSV